MHLDLTYAEGLGWHVGVIARAHGGEWADSRRTHYANVATNELLDLVWAELAARLGLL